MTAPALQVFAGPAARALLAERGLRAADVGLVPAAAGGPKGLVLNGLDRHLFGEFLAQSQQPVHLVGASIGAWRMAAAACAHQTAEAAPLFERMAEAYIEQRYDPEPGQRRLPAAAVTARFQRTLQQEFGGQEARPLAHPRWRLHLVTSRGLGLLARESRWRTPMGYLAAFAANAVHRPWMGRWLERVVFSDPRSPLPLPLSDYRSRVLALRPDNFQAALLASCSIPFYLQAQVGIPGAPAGAYWDGGITDYHLHWDYHSLAGQASPLVLYPHFQRAVVPGWLDKALKHRHRASAFLSQAVVLAPHPDWVARLPGGKLPDRQDFAALTVAERQRRWRQVVAESARLAEDFERLTRQNSVLAEAL